MHRMTYSGDLQRIAQKCGALVADLVADAFAGETLYIPKGGRYAASTYVRANPDATAAQIMTACQVSKTTAYRALREVTDGKGR